MTKFAKVVSVLILILCVIAIIGGIGTASELNGTEADITVLFTIISAALLAGLSTIVWNIAAMVESARKVDEKDPYSNL